MEYLFKQTFTVPRIPSAVVKWTLLPAPTKAVAPHCWPPAPALQARPHILPIHGPSLLPVPGQPRLLQRWHNSMAPGMTVIRLAKHLGSHIHQMDFAVKQHSSRIVPSGIPRYPLLLLGYSESLQLIRMDAEWLNAEFHNSQKQVERKSVSQKELYFSIQGAQTDRRGQEYDYRAGWGLG